MEREVKIRQAKNIMKGLLYRMGRKTGFRFHTQAAVDTDNRLRSLEGICGNCRNMGLRFYRSAGKHVAEVTCNAGHTPHILYDNTPLGTPAECNDFKLENK